MTLTYNNTYISSRPLPLSSIFFTKWTAYALYARVRKCGLSSSNTTSLSACEQCLTQVFQSKQKRKQKIKNWNYSKRMWNWKLKKKKWIPSYKQTYLENARRNVRPRNLRNLPLHLLQGFCHQPSIIKKSKLNTWGDWRGKKVISVVNIFTTGTYFALSSLAISWRLIFSHRRASSCLELDI